MRLVLPAPPPGVTIRIGADEPLPVDVKAWHQRAVDREQVVSTEYTHTTAGWPLTLVQTSDALHGFFELFDRAVIVVASTPEAHHADLARSLMLAGDIDREQRDVVALAQVWEER